jgi:hypothetical protein
MAREILIADPDKADQEGFKRRTARMRCSK